LRCYICNKENAENVDPRDDTWLCDACDEEIKSIIYEWEEEESVEDSPDVP